jgi:hypothetical protein
MDFNKVLYWGAPNKKSFEIMKLFSFAPVNDSPYDQIELHMNFQKQLIAKILVH